MKSQLRGLPDTRRVRRCEFITSGAAAVRWVRQGIAATAANDYGAINIWDDKYGKYRCESMTYGVTVESKSFTRLVDVRRWATDWLHKISTGDFEQVPYLVGKEKP